MPDTSSAIEIARQLIRAGIPVFAAPPALDPAGQWDPSGGTGHCGYILPTNWQRTVPTEHWLDAAPGSPMVRTAWRPGWALGLVMGHGLDLLDCDPRNGSAETRQGLVEGGLWPRVYALAVTPSGGTHELVASLGVGSRDGVRPGLDVKGGMPDGGSRGFAFIAPTVKASKTTGEIAPYVWVKTPDLDRLWLAEGKDDTGIGIADLVRQAKARKPPSEDGGTAGLFEGKEWPHSGSIPDGKRHHALVSYAGSLRRRDVHYDEALTLYRLRWQDCAQPPDARSPVTWGEAVEKLRDVYSRYSPDDPDEPEPTGDEPPTGRTLTLLKASAIIPKPVRWAWETADEQTDEVHGRFPTGSLVVAVGRASLGKSQFGIWLTAQITRGTLPGVHYGKPRAVVYAASEDSWAMTIVPRLIAAGADLDLVYRVDVASDENLHATLTLPTDTRQLGKVITENDVVMLVCDPLLSMIDAGVNDYRAREVRSALEPLVAMADRTGCLVLGVAHFTKGTGTDPLMLISGSGAFGQLIRAGVGFARDDDTEDGGLVLSTIKNNLGREDLPSLSYRIEPAEIDTPTGTAHVSRFVLAGQSDRSVRDILSDGGTNPEERAERDAAAEWLVEYVHGEGDSVLASDVIKAGAASGYLKHTLQRARKRAGIVTRKTGKPGEPGAWVWLTEGDTKVTKVTTPETQSPSSPSLSPSVLSEPRPALADEPDDEHLTVDPRRCTECHRLKPPGSTDPLCAPCDAKAGAA